MSKLTISRSENAAYGSSFEQATVNLINYCAPDSAAPEFAGAYAEAAYDYQDVEDWAEEQAIIADESGEWPFGEAIAQTLPTHPEDIPIIYEHAANAVEELLATVGEDSLMFGAIRTGQSVHDSNGDIRLVDGTCVEAKYVRQGLGTYANMSMNAVAQAVDYKPYTGINSFLAENDWEGFLLNRLGQDLFMDYGVDCTNASPMSMHDSSDFRHEHKSLYRAIAKKERELRREYVNGFHDHICSDASRVDELLTELMSKDISNKAVPDYYLVCSHVTSICRCFDIRSLMDAQVEQYEPDEFDEFDDVQADYDIEEQLANEVQEEDVSEDYHYIVNAHLRGGYSIVFPGLLRATFAWQNGTGLCNPTVRTFLLFR